jgi:hypothetical protein
MDQLSFMSDLLASSTSFAPEILRLNAAILLVAALACLAPLALRRFATGRTRSMRPARAS